MSEKSPIRHEAELGGSENFIQTLADYFSHSPGSGYIALVSIIISLVGAYNYLPCQFAWMNGHSCSKHTDPNGSGSPEPAAPVQQVPPSVPNTQLDTETIWQLLQSDLDRVKRSPSFVNDKAVRSTYQNLRSRGLTATSKVQTQLLHDAQVIIQKLDTSDSNLRTIHDTANAWHDRKRYETPEVGKVLDDLTDTDKQRADEEGYLDDLQTLQSANELMQWVQRGFTSKTPVYLYTDSPELNDIRIVNWLQDALNGFLYFVDEPHAALFIEIGKTDMRGQTEQSAFGKPTGHASFMMRIRWLNGTWLLRTTISKASTDSSGSGNALGNRDSAQANATTDAIIDAVSRIRRLLAK